MCETANRLSASLGRPQMKQVYIVLNLIQFSVLNDTRSAKLCTPKKTPEARFTSQSPRLKRRPEEQERQPVQAEKAHKMLGRELRQAYLDIIIISLYPP